MIKMRHFKDYVKMEAEGRSSIWEIRNLIPTNRNHCRGQERPSSPEEDSVQCWKWLRAESALLFTSPIISDCLVEAAIDESFERVDVKSERVYIICQSQKILKLA
jgi:hypothetical protein